MKGYLSKLKNLLRMPLTVPIPGQCLSDYRRMIARDNLFRLACMSIAFMLLRALLMVTDLAGWTASEELLRPYIVTSVIYLCVSFIFVAVFAVALIRSMFSTATRRVLCALYILFFLLSQIVFFYYEYSLSGTGLTFILAVFAVCAVPLSGLFPALGYILTLLGGTFIAFYFIDSPSFPMLQLGLYLFAITMLSFFVSRIFYFNYNTNFIAQQKLLISNQQLLSLNEDLERLSFTDHLTQIPNRRALDIQYEYIWKMCLRQYQPFSVLMIDIDNFSEYNNEFGHLQGDQCLVKVSACLKRSFKRSIDFVARFGGEEFVVLLPFTEQEDAVKMSEYARREIEALQIPHPNSPVSPYVTVSVGSNTIRPTGDVTSSSLIGGADDALYRAKNGGKNRCSQ